jgi:hypothetical protein
VCRSEAAGARVAGVAAALEIVGASAARRNAAGAGDLTGQLVADGGRAAGSEVGAGAVHAEAANAAERKEFAAQESNLRPADRALGLRYVSMPIAPFDRSTATGTAIGFVVDYMQ